MAAREQFGRLSRAPRAALRTARAYLRPRPAILLYHRIAEDAFDPWGLCVAFQHFAAQLEWLARSRSVLSLPDFARRHIEGRLPPDALAITFDDGYRCNAATAAPMLERIGLPATIFLPIALIEDGNEFWWDELRRLVLAHRSESVRLGGSTVQLGPATEADGHWSPGAPPLTQRQRAFAELWSSFRRMRPAAVASAMAALREQAGDGLPAPETRRPMSAQEARAIGSPLIELGSHTLAHSSLSVQSSAAKRRQVHDSADRCAAVTGARPRALAYPFGDFDAESERMAEEAGYECACTTELATIGRRARPFALPRITVGNWSPRRLGRALATV